MTRPTLNVRKIDYDEQRLSTPLKKTEQSTLDKFINKNTFQCYICNNKIDINTFHRNDGMCSNCIKLDRDTLDIAKSIILTKLSNKQNEHWSKEISMMRSCSACAQQSQQATLFQHGTALGEDNCINIDCKVMLSRCKIIVDIEDTMQEIRLHE